jgi:quaternary ammonium compound-resistance protein SugE
MDWIYLVLAGLLEIGWAVGLKYSDGFSKPIPTIMTVITMVASFTLLAIALKSIPVGTGYAVWTGIGAVGTAIAGIVLFGESRDMMRIACIVLIIVGIAGLKFATPVEVR